MPVQYIAIYVCSIPQSQKHMTFWYNSLVTLSRSDLEHGVLEVPVQIEGTAGENIVQAALQYNKSTECFLRKQLDIVNRQTAIRLAKKGRRNRNRTLGADSMRMEMLGASQQAPTKLAMLLWRMSLMFFTSSRILVVIGSTSLLIILMATSTPFHLP